MTNIFFDIETDSLDPTVIHCACVRNPRGEFSYTHPMDFITGFSKGMSSPTGEVSEYNLIGHNIIGFDLPVLQKLWGVNYCIEPDIFNDSKVKIIDTLVWSRYLYPDRPGGHSLEAWGERLGHLKLEHKNFTTYTPEMLEYCKNDVLLTEKVYNHLLTKEMQSL